jgi:tetratricopeptide (TPR) repeat protein
MKPASNPLARLPGGIRKIKPEEKIQALLTLALREYSAGRMAEAERFCLQMLALDVRHANALYLLGMAGYQTGRFELAERMIRRAIAVNPRQAFYHSNLGNALAAQGRLDEAQAYLERALAIKPDHQEACYNLGNAFLARKKFDEAAALYKRALAIKPHYPDALCNLGGVYRRQNRLDEAVDCFARALALAPDNPDLCCNLGDALHAQGKVEEAMGWYRRTLTLKPDHPKACNCLCNAFFDLGDLAESVAWCDRALAIRPGFADALMNQCLLQLLQGDYLNGWRNYEVRWKAYMPRTFTQPLWLGAPLRGTRILLYSEQGLGDSLQFLRYVPMVQAAGGRVLLDLPANLRRIAAEIPGLAALVNTGHALPHFDCRCPLLSLPLAFATTLETVPSKVPYLAAPSEALAAAEALSWPAAGLRVGIAWTGSLTHPKNRARSVPFDLLQPLFDIEGVHFFSLQMGPAAAKVAAGNAKITNLAPFTGDMADTAAQIAYLDLVISIDTSVAHLAGALGKPVWVLLCHTPDWRWLLDREDSPWYPTARLFRQPKPGDWPSVIEKARAELTVLAPRTRENWLPSPPPE